MKTNLKYYDGKMELTEGEYTLERALQILALIPNINNY